MRVVKKRARIPGPCCWGENREQMALKSSRGEQLVNTASMYGMGRRRSAPPHAVPRGGRPCAICCSHSDHKTRSCGLRRALAHAAVDGCTAVLCGKENSPQKSPAYRAGPLSVSQAHTPQGLEAWFDLVWRWPNAAGESKKPFKSPLKALP